MTIRTSLVLFSLLLSLSMIVASCGPTATPTVMPTQAQGLAITNITENSKLDGQIIQTRDYDQCESASALNTQTQFSKSNTNSQQEELVLGASVSGEVGISAAAKVEIQGSIEQHFASVNTTEQGYQEVIAIEVPPHTHQEYTIIWKETRREGTIEYEENGEKKTTSYSYRIGLEFMSSRARNIVCPVQVTETLGETPTLEPSATSAVIKTIADGCIFSETWNIYSTNNNALNNTSVGLNGCRSLGPLGISADDDGIVHIFSNEKNIAVESGMFTPITDNSVIEFDIFVNYMYLVYNDAPATITFGVAPADDTRALRESTRFKLQVEKNESRPIVFFMMADAGEFTGIKVPNQHYEYGRTYNIRLEVTDLLMNVYINDNKMQERLSLPDGNKVFYINYNIPIRSGVDLQIKDLSIDGESV